MSVKSDHSKRCKYPLFFKKTTNFFGTEDHEIIRAKDSVFGKSSLKEGSQPLTVLLKQKASSLEQIDFIEKCLIIDPKLRITP